MKKHSKAARAPQSLPAPALAAILGGGGIGGLGGGVGLTLDGGGAISALGGSIGGLGGGQALDTGIGASATVFGGGIGGFGRTTIAP
jgi:hypothetical protein